MGIQQTAKGAGIALCGVTLVATGWMILRRTPPAPVSNPVTNKVVIPEREFRKPPSRPIKTTSPPAVARPPRPHADTPPAERRAPKRDQPRNQKNPMPVCG